MISSGCSRPFAIKGVLAPVVGLSRSHTHPTPLTSAHLLPQTHPTPPASTHTPRHVTQVSSLTPRPSLTHARKLIQQQSAIDTHSAHWPTHSSYYFSLASSPSHRTHNIHPCCCRSRLRGDGPKRLLEYFAFFSSFLFFFFSSFSFLLFQPLTFLLCCAVAVPPSRCHRSTRCGGR